MGTVKYDKLLINAGVVIKRTFYNDITILDVMNSFEYLLENHLSENDKFIALITDLKQSNLKFNLMDFRRMLSFIKQNNILANIPMAVIFDSPIHNLFPTIASKTLGIHVKPFNSMNEAIVWIETLKTKT